MGYCLAGLESFSLLLLPSSSLSYTSLLEVAPSAAEELLSMQSSMQLISLLA